MRPIATAPGSDRKKMAKVGIALSGGGARGFAHVGVLKALVENDIAIDLVSGVSAGSFVGGALAAGMTIDEIVELGEKISWRRVAGFSYSPRGLLSSASMGTFIEKNFPATRFEDLKLPFAAVACDLETGDEVVLRDAGDLAFAIRASCAIPGVFVPMIDEHGRSLIDGGAATPMPTRAVKKLGADVVIAVDVVSCGSTFWGTPSTLVGTFFQSAMHMIRSASKNHHYRADIVIEPQIAHIRPDAIAKRDELIELGEQAALEKIEAIKRAIDIAQT
ncbi:MAG: patatin-like phospholipase family protein [Acidobacteria bacterium]|nr:patatin-like phospholipase family protein [Acidobacteriota bacterium]